MKGGDYEMEAFSHPRTLAPTHPRTHTPSYSRTLAPSLYSIKVEEFLEWNGDG